MTDDEYEEHGLAIRTKACELAALVMASRPDECCVPTLWNLAVFFESYLLKGANDTAEDFGPKDALILKTS